MADPEKTDAQVDTKAGGTDGQTSAPADQKTDSAAQGKGADDQSKQPAGTSQQDGQQKAGDDGKQKDKLEGAPEKYANFVVPQGVTLDAEKLGKFTDMAKELNLSQANAQRLVDLAAEHTESVLKSQADQWSKIREGWVKELKEDTEFGGQKFDETIVRAKRCMSKFGDPEFSKMLESTGYGDNPSLIRLLARIDKAIGEDTTETGKPAAGAAKSTAEVMYGK